MKKFEIFDHTADIGIIVFGKTLEEVFCNAAFGMFSIITELQRVRESKGITLSVEAEDTESLLVGWLSELLFYQNVREMLLKRFEIKEISKKNLLGEAFGEEYDPGRHLLKKEIKTVTYHQLKIEKTREGWQAKVIFDI
jgi:SHS2 domain-containing protein